MNNMETQSNKPIYRLVDCRGRIYLPKELREAGDMQPGDIVKLDMQNGRVCAERVHIVEVGDKSPEAVETFVRTSIRHMSPRSQFDLAACLMDLLKQEGGR